MRTIQRLHVASVIAFALCTTAFTAQKPPKEKKEPPKKEAPKPVEIEPFVGTWSDAKRLASERNVPVIAHVVLESEEASDRYRDKLLPDKELVLASVNSVVVIANNGTHAKKAVEVTQPDGSKTRKEVCSVYGTPSCGAHQKLWEELYRELHAEDGGMPCPQSLVLSPAGEVALHVNKGEPPSVDELVSALQEASAKAGPGLTNEALLEVKKLVAEGTTFVESKAWPDAERAWTKLLGITPKGAWADQANAALPGVRAGLAAELERLTALLVPGKAAEGYRLLSEFQKACLGLAIEKEIAPRLKKAESDKTIKDEIAAWKLEVEASAILSEAQAAADGGDEKKAQRTVRKLFGKRFAETQATATARKLWPEIAAEEAAKGAK